MPAGGCWEQGHRNRADDDPSHFPLPPPPFPTEMKKHEQAESLPYCCAGQGRSPSTGNGGRDQDAPPLPSTELAFEEHEQHPLGSLPADILVGVLSRVPYKSLCRFKCVSKPWLALCSDTDVRKRCPQTLSGFFYDYRGCFKFHNLSGRGPPLVDPSLPFLHRHYNHIIVEQCCSGLLLCTCFEEGEYDCDYVVCNPMTGQWAALPPIVSSDEVDYTLCFEPAQIFLGFDAAVPSRFVVFVPMTDIGRGFTEISVYSSETGLWTRVKSEWGYKTIPFGKSQCVFLNGTMHLAIQYGFVLTLDACGKVWREIEMPDHTPGSNNKVSIGQSQGHLYAWQIDTSNDDSQLYVWVLEDYVSGKWTLKHSAAVSELFGRQSGEDDMNYIVLAMHPDCNCIFITDEEEMTVSYNMDTQKVNVSCTSQKFEDVLPYTPCFAEWSKDGH